MQINFTIPGKPFGKQRPKFASRGKFVKAYTPQETVNYENLVKYAWMEAGSVRLGDGPIDMRIEAVFEVPASWSKKKRALALEGQVVPGKPDWDNLGKVVSDALNGLAYKDDAQVSAARVTKRYGDVACMIVEVRDAV